MKQKHLVWLIVLLVGAFLASYATYSRVESMGKSDDFFMDDISIFTNPANVNLYANFLTGELGQIYAWESWRDMMNDPHNQWFGGAASYKIGDGSKVTLGVVFNREDDLITKLRAYNSKKYLVKFPDTLKVGQFAYRTPGTNLWTTTPSTKLDTLRASDQIVYDYMFPGQPGYDSLKVATWNIFQYSVNVVPIAEIPYTKNIPLPVGKTEFFLGYSNGKDLHVGGHFYLAKQDTGLKDNESARAESHLYRGDVGVNYGIGNHSLEVSLGIADLGFKLNAPSTKLSEVTSLFATAESKTSIMANLRFFYDMPKIGSKIVPVFGYSDSKVNVFSETQIKGGLGLNKEIEKGLFYAGLTGTQVKSKDETVQRDWSRTSDSAFTTDTTTSSAKINFGIERNIAWKWFIVRVGGQKELAKQTVTKTYPRSTTQMGKFVSTPDENGTIEDAIGFGIGFNFDNKLKVDATMNEQFPYQNPFGYLGDVGKRIATRVSATYSF